MYRVLKFLVLGLFLVGAQHLSFSQKTITGETRKMGNGTLKSWVKVDKKGNPRAIGVAFTESALTGLPKPGDSGGQPLTLFPDFVSYEYVLSLPEEAARTPFKHIVVNWNPAGHPPHFYALPHFDFHFYMMTNEARTAITCVGEDTLRVYKQPEKELIPAAYTTAPMTGEGRMGWHWFDPASDEFHGHDFTKTFIYGYYDGKMNFMEPMITKAYLDSKPTMSEKIKLPARYPVTGVYYPTSYSVKYDRRAKEYTVALEGMTRR